MSEDINIGQISEAINNKMDRDLNNRTTNICYVIDSDVDGTEGYRVWSHDGIGHYCEQWGQLDCVKAGTTIQFTKAFTNTNYIISTGKIYSGNVGYYALPTVTKGTESFVCYDYDSKTVTWKACGYLAEGQY